MHLNLVSHLPPPLQHSEALKSPALLKTHIPSRVLNTPLHILSSTSSRLKRVHLRSRCFISFRAASWNSLTQKSPLASSKISITLWAIIVNCRLIWKTSATRQGRDRNLGETGRKWDLHRTSAPSDFQTRPLPLEPRSLPFMMLSPALCTPPQPHPDSYSNLTDHLDISSSVRICSKFFASTVLGFIHFTHCFLPLLHLWFLWRLLLCCVLQKRRCWNAAFLL